jgi:hypothetical protein
VWAAYVSHLISHPCRSSRLDAGSSRFVLHTSGRCDDERHEVVWVVLFFVVCVLLDGWGWVWLCSKMAVTDGYMSI